MQQAFATAITAGSQPRHQCLGLTLQPLTVGHLFALLEIGNPFPDYAEEATFHDLVLAVLVCSHKRPERFSRFMETRRAKLFMIVWGWLMRNRAWLLEVTAFQAYLAESFQKPETRATPPGELKVPLCWRLLAMLMADFHLTREQAMRTPVAEALVLWITEADRREAIKILSDRDIAFREWAAEQERIRLSQEKQ